MKLLFHRIFLSAFLVLVALVLPADSFGAEPPISIVCPCNVERVNQTKAVAKFSVAFDKEVNESGEFLVEIARRDTIGQRQNSYYIIASTTVSTLDYASGANAIEVSLPFFINNTAEDQFLSLSLHLLDQTLIDLVALNEESLTIGDRYGVNYSADNQIVFDTPVSFQYDSSSFSFAVTKVSNINLKNVSDIVTVEMSVANAEGSYIIKSEVETTVDYDASNAGSLSVSGALSEVMDDHLSVYPDFTNIQVRILRNDNLLLRNQVGALEGGYMPTFALNLNNIDTLFDTDSDGISDFNERTIGTSETVPNPIDSIPIEIAFTYGEAAKTDQGEGLEARIAYILAVTNAAFSDSGLNINFQETFSYEVGDDTNLNSAEVLDAFGNREGIFSEFDSDAVRKPDLIIHLSTLQSFEDGIGGRASLLGGNSNGIIGYQDIYSSGRNTGTVAIDNYSLTLAHEIGHLMGLDHARRQYDSSPSGTFRWSVGHGQDNLFSTIMAYSSSFGSASGVGLFSSPLLKCGTSQLPCGVDRGDYLRGADSVKSLQTTAHQIAAISNGFPPGITLTGDKTVTIAIGQTYSEPGFSAYDKEDGNLTSSLVATNNIDNTKSGTYTVTYEVSDADSNKSSATRAVVVAGSEPEPTEIFVRLNSNPFRSPYYIFSSSEKGAPLSLELVKGETYAFTRTDSGHPFNIGVSWRAADSYISMSSTGSSYVVSGIASIEGGSDGGGYYGTGATPDGRLIISIPSDFSKGSIAYYCYLHSNMVGTLSVIDSNISDTDSDGIPDSSDSDDDADGVNDSIDAFPLDASEIKDTDSDGIGDNADTDDDDDGYSDNEEVDYETDPLDADSYPIIRGLDWGLIKTVLDKQNRSAD